MSPVTFFISSFAAPFVGIALIAPAIRARRWTVVGALMAAIAVAVFLSLAGRYATGSGILRSLAVGLLAVAAGYLYQRHFMDRDRAGR